MTPNRPVESANSVGKSSPNNMLQKALQSHIPHTLLTPTYNIK